MAENLLQEIDFNIVSRLETLGFNIEEMSESIEFTVYGLINDAAMQARFAYEAIRAYEQALAANEDTVELQAEIEQIAEQLQNQYNTLVAMIPTNVSQLANDKGYISEETDPTVPQWAKEPDKPQYGADEIVGLSEVAQTGSYNDLYDTPTIPTDLTDDVKEIQEELANKADINDIPNELPNPYPIIINGTAYDGSEEKEFTLGGGGGTTYTLTKDGNQIILNGADGTSSQVTDSDTIYDDTAVKATIPKYATCSTAAATQIKEASTPNGDFVLAEGAMVRVKFENAQTYNGGIKLNVDNTGAKNVMRQGTTVTARYFYLAGEVIDFVYDGTNFLAVNEGMASTTYYGVTKLTNSTSSTSTSTAATPNSVKLAYDHADSKQDALVSGTNIKTINNNSLLGSGDLNVVETETDPTVPSWAKQPSKPTYTASEVGALPDSTVIPSKTSDLSNDSDFVSDASYVHTDNNFTTEEKNKLSGISSHANRISSTTASYSFTAKSAGTAGYFQVSWDETLANRPINAYVHTTSISALNGTQFSLVNATTSGAYFTYYCRNATTATITLTIYAYYAN